MRRFAALAVSGNDRAWGQRAQRRPDHHAGAEANRCHPRLKPLLPSRNGLGTAHWPQLPRARRVRTERGSSVGITPVVGLIMGSDSDWPVMKAAAGALAEFDVPNEVRVVSAHRTPHRMLEYARMAADRGLKIIIAGTGGAAHLPGMIASATAARHRCSCALQEPRRLGLVALNRADAGRRSPRSPSPVPATPGCSPYGCSVSRTRNLSSAWPNTNVSSSIWWLRRTAPFRPRCDVGRSEFCLSGPRGT